MFRLTLATCVILTAAVPAQSCGTTPQPDARRGEALFASNCAACHLSKARVVRMIKGETEQERATWLDAELARHEAEDAGERADIIAWLMQQE